MPSAVQLRALLEQTSSPDSGFNVVPVPGCDGYRIGRGLEDSVVLLTPPEVQPDAPTHLRRISLSPRILCRVESGEVVERVEAGVVEFRDTDASLIDHFLGVAGALVELLGPQPAAGEVSRGMQRLLRLFAAPTRGRGSELGVWGELLVMLDSDDPSTLMDAWHARVDDRFDFSAEGARLEVKTTARAERVHQFGLHQLLQVPGCEQHVLSLMTSETDLGSSVGDLVERLQQRLTASPERQMKLLEQIADILGPDWPQTARHKFDEEAALGSLRVMEASAVPRVEPGPPDVLDVRLTVDVSMVAPAVPSSYASFWAPIAGQGARGAGTGHGPGRQGRGGLP